MTRAEMPVAIVGATVADGKVAIAAAVNDTGRARGCPPTRC
jgi:hypothetical protein